MSSGITIACQLRAWGKKREVRDRRSEVRGEADLRSPASDLCDRRLERLERLERFEGFDELTRFALGSAAR